MSIALGTMRRGDERTISLYGTKPTGERETFSDKLILWTAHLAEGDPPFLTKSFGGVGANGITVDNVPPGTSFGAGGDVITITLTGADTALLPDYPVTLFWKCAIEPFSGGDPQTPWDGSLAVRP